MPDGTETKKYADDILNYIIGKQIQADLPRLVVDLVSRWCDGNKMRLNTSKCKVMMISKYPTAEPPAYIENTSLEAVVNYKYLGIELNNTIQWDLQ